MYWAQIVYLTLLAMTVVISMSLVGKARTGKWGWSDVIRQIITAAFIYLMGGLSHVFPGFW